MDEEYWRRFRKRARERAAAWGLLVIIAPLGIVVAVLKVLEPMDHPAGDPRDDILVRLIVNGAFVAFDIALMVGCIRLLRRPPDDDGIA